MNNAENIIEPRLTYIFAKIRISTRRCVGVLTTEENKAPSTLYEYVPLTELNNDYIGKYYINGAWYEDAAGTIPWSPAE